MNHSNCHCEHVVSGPVGHVTLCADCGQVHLTMHYMTVRFELEAFRTFAAMIGEAQQRIDCAAIASISAPQAANGLH